MYLHNIVFQAMTTYGYEIVQTLIVDIIPDSTVKKAMNEINAGMPNEFRLRNGIQIVVCKWSM